MLFISCNTVSQNKDWKILVLKTDESFDPQELRPNESLT